ncbi:hypothetical protein OUZ56_004791 [Daphnia magna]|uniref:Uncharacterized protein n=1 Tax=Daphnia magna TaxID=35525 RepID=A0ABQ9YQV3_9CRUS|nr:hypothetical protein OUZ56_004791 [Daphnia magna]
MGSIAAVPNKVGTVYTYCYNHLATTPPFFQETFQTNRSDYQIYFPSEMQIYLVIKSVGDCHVVTSRYTPNDGRRAVIANAEIDFRSLPGKEIGVMVFVTLIASTICEVPLHA